MTEPLSQPFIFISYSRADHDLVMRLQSDLLGRGIKIWIDKEDLQPGTPDWEEALRTAIRAAHAVLLIASPNARSSRYVKDELRLAEMYQRPVYPLWVAGTQWMEAVPLGWGGTQYIDAREKRYEMALNELVALLNRVSSLIDSEAISPKKPEPDFEPRNPYKGLKAFTSADASDFFGRDSLIGELIETLKESLASERRDMQGARLLAVVGPSGSGKSSVVMAGLLPCLCNDQLPGSKEWMYLDPLVPGKHPIEALTLVFAEKMPDRSLKTIREDLEDDTARGLHLLATTLAKPQRTNVVLVVDQFEELFIQTAAEDERRHFIDLLTTAITEPNGPVIVILTLRADFYDRPIKYPELAQLIQKHQHLVLPMDLKDLRAVIEKPAALPDVQMIFEADLVGNLLFEVQGQVGALPLLQFTLDQLFQRRSGYLLTLKAYDEIGGVKGALTKQAESTYADLPSGEHRQLARALFMRLIDPGATEQDTTRRRAALSEFSLADATQTRLLQETIEAFIAARLLTTNEIAGTTTIEVSHEALIREWARLSEWLREAREDIKLQQIISEDAAEWEQHKKPRDRLYRGSQLKDAQAWARRNIPSENEEAFLRTSAVQRTRTIMSVLAIVLLLLSTTGLTGWLLLRPSPNSTVVTTPNDDVSGSLRRIIDNASPGSTITFDPSLHGKTIMLTSGDLNITKNLRLLGPSTGGLAISSGKYGYAVIVPGSSVSISNLTFEHSDNTIITNEGTLTLTNCTVSGNKGLFGSIYNKSGSQLTLINSTASGNSTSKGGGIYNSNGKVTLINSLITGNSGYGGVYNERATLAPTSSEEGTLTLINSTVSNNNGGGIVNYNGSVILTNSTVSGNSASDSGGGIFNNGGTLMFTNSTISDNTASTYSNLGGGGIATSGGLAYITFCTIYGNTTHSNFSSSPANGGGVAIDNTIPSQVVMRNSIVADNHVDHGNGPDISGSVITYGYNLIQDFSGVTFVDPLKKHATDLQGNSFPGLAIDPVLRNTGGPTQTHALHPGSPAIDKIPLGDCNINGITLDQRGMKRPDEDEKFCDIGAYESTP
jgi:hypothetical protein